MLNKLFKLTENKTTIQTEIIGGITTFMTMAYIIFVQPAILSKAGMDFGAVMVATCLASALGTFLMAFLANYPIAQAPAMGHNFFFVYTVCIGMGVAWQKALGANFISGVIFIAASVFAFREKIMEAIPESLKNAIAVGIGLLIAFVGLEWSGLVVAKEGTLIGLGNVKSAPVLMSLFGLLLITLLLIRKVKGAMLWGMVITALISLPFGITKFYGLISKPPSIAPTLLKLDIKGAFDVGLITVIFVLFFLDLFDSIGTLVGVAQVGGFMKAGKLPRAKQAFLADAVATSAGTMLGTSTTSSYIESAAGIASGAKTGFANIVTGILFLLAIFFYPLVKMIGEGYPNGPGTSLHPVTSPALIIVGCMMLKNIIKINWDDFTEAIPAFITLIIMPVTFSITDGIAFGFIGYCLLSLLSGKGKDVSWIMYLFSALFIVRYIIS